MPSKPRWLLNIPEIIGALDSLTTPIVDRSFCEKLFRLRRRRTIDLMQSFGGYKAGNTMLIDRDGLIDRLRQIADSPETLYEKRRKERLADSLDKLHRFRKAMQVRIAVKPNIQEQTVRDLEPIVTLQPGRLAVEFSDTQELLSNLYLLSQVAVNDFDAFYEAVVRGGWAPKPSRSA